MTQTFIDIELKGHIQASLHVGLSAEVQCQSRTFYGYLSTMR